MDSRIVAFGCSHTRGAGIFDVWVDNGYTDDASEYSYVNVLANEAKLPFLNQSVNAASNKQIADLILNFQFEVNDIVYVMWTHIERTCIIKKDMTWQITPWIKDDRNNVYYEHLYDYNNLLLESQQYIQLAKNHLEKNKVKFFFCNYDKIKYLKTNWFDAEFIDLYFMDYEIDYAEDLHHLGVESNKKFGLDLYKHTIEG